MFSQIYIKIIFFVYLMYIFNYQKYKEFLKCVEDLKINYEYFLLI